VKVKLRAAEAVLVLVLTAILPATPAQAQASGCLPDVGKEVPVLFVHGFNSNSRIWGDDQHNFRKTVNDLGEISTHAFSYEQNSWRWITDEHIGHALADQITCMATSSRQQGGRGQVIVVAHSMGGLAVRQAMSENSEVIKDLGLVITIATPNEGSFVGQQTLASLRVLCALDVTGSCNSSLDTLSKVLTSLPGLAAGSNELRQLPDWPSIVPVYAIAGNIALHYNLFGAEFDATYSGNDTLVTVKSALHGVVIGRLGGTKAVKCSGGPPPLVSGWTHASCGHNALVGNELVQKAAQDQIRTYLASIPLPGTVTQSPKKTPVTCNGRAFYQGEGYTLQASAIVMNGNVTCTEAVQVAQAYLEQSGPRDQTVIGPWTCHVDTSATPGFIATCNSADGEIRLNGE